MHRPFIPYMRRPSMMDPTLVIAIHPNNLAEPFSHVGRLVFGLLRPVRRQHSNSSKVPKNRLWLSLCKLPVQGKLCIIMAGVGLTTHQSGLTSDVLESSLPKHLGVCLLLRLLSHMLRFLCSGNLGWSLWAFQSARVCRPCNRHSSCNIVVQPGVKSGLSCSYAGAHDNVANTNMLRFICELE